MSLKQELWTVLFEVHIRLQRTTEGTARETAERPDVLRPVGLPRRAGEGPGKTWTASVTGESGVWKRGRSRGGSETL